MIHVLLVDDDSAFLSLLKRDHEEDAELTKTTTSRVPEAMERFKTEHFDAIVSDYLSITDITTTKNGEPGKGARFKMTVPKGAHRFIMLQP
jgi:ActR/RegA family two-component response regulator